MPIGARPKKSQQQDFGSNPKAIKGRCLSSTGRSSSLFWDVSLSVPNSGLQLIGRGPLTWGKAICFTQSTDSNADLIQNTFTDIPRIVLDQISGHPWLSQADTSNELSQSLSTFWKRNPYIYLSEEMKKALMLNITFQVSKGGRFWWVFPQRPFCTPPTPHWVLFHFLSKPQMILDP